MAQEVQNGITIPLLHIADPTGEAIKSRGITKIGLLGTKFTLEHDFYKGRLNEMFGLEVAVPDEQDRQSVHDSIYNELCLGEVKQTSKEKYVEIIQKLSKQGAQGVILGCT